MAEDEKAPEEAAPTPPEEPQARPGRRRGRKVDPPLSLYPLSFEEAVGGLLEVKPEPEERKLK